MRMMMAAAMTVLAVAASGFGAGVAQAYNVPPIKGNDTGGIISYNLAGQADIKAIAVNHCASYGKVVKPLAVQPVYGGYISFACIWVPPAPPALRVRY